MKKRSEIKLRIQMNKAEIASLDNKLAMHNPSHLVVHSVRAIDDYNTFTSTTRLRREHLISQNQALQWVIGEASTLDI